MTPQTVSMWRKALDVPRYNEGTQRLDRDWFPERMTAAERARGVGLANALAANAKEAAAARGGRRTAHVVEAVRQAHLGKPLSAAHRAKLSAAHKARGTKPPGTGRLWTRREDALLGTLPDRKVAERVGRSAAVVWERRERLGIPRTVRRQKSRTKL